MFLVIDNYDSFVHNLARYFELADVQCEVIRNDKITTNDIKDMAPEALVLSRGPCTPNEAGICLQAVKAFGASTPILGVCLGHQVITEAYNGKTIQSQQPIHGQSSLLTHNQKGIFEGIKSPLTVGRYHSLICELDKKSELEITATLDDNTIMAVQHKMHPVYGVQFHPESILTENGQDIVQNFVSMTHKWNEQKAA